MVNLKPVRSTSTYIINNLGTANNELQYRNVIIYNSELNNQMTHKIATLLGRHMYAAVYIPRC